jgi:hypothetical protein
MAGAMAIGAVMVAVVDAALPVPLVAVALIMHVPEDNGAVYKPVFEIVPQLAVHLAAVLATNCCVAPPVNSGFMGLIERVGSGAMMSYP